jgi:enamine deaminase RidA (YjgF/YER057c/UK114 family)
MEDGGMQGRPINAPDAPPPLGRYAQAFEVAGARRLLFISGQVPTAADGTLADGFEAQCRQVWANLEAQLRAAGMTLDNLVKVSIYLADRAHAGANRAIRQEVLGERTPALTVLIAGIFDATWLIEIEAVAAG